MRVGLSRLGRPRLPAVAAVLLGLTGASCALAAGTASASSLPAVGKPPATTTATFTPGQPWDDQNGNALQTHGLGIVKAGSTWYAFGEDKTGENSSDTSFRDIPCYSSANLGTWTFVSDALTRQASGDLGPNRIVERPKVIYNATTKQYVMYLHIDDPTYSEAKVGVATSPTVCGPYTYHGSFQPLGFQSRDIGLYQASDGTAYLLSEDRANGLRIDKLSADYLSVTSAVAVLPDREAPALVKAGGRYYMLGSQLSGWSPNDNGYSTATSLSGPWSSWQDFAPGGTNTYSSQTANIITVQGTKGTAYIYAGDRWTTGDLGTSPLVWLPMKVKGKSLSVRWYGTWALNVSAGTWSAKSTTPFKGAQSGRCLDVPNQSTTPGTTLDIWDCTGAGNQNWTVNANGTITGVQSGLCLDASGQGTSPGTAVDVWTCNGQANQQWKVNAGGTVTGTQSGLCLEAAGQGTANGTAIDISTCNGAANQQWSRP